jgi:L-ribulose-5-phosphate 3-epimerase
MPVSRRDFHRTSLALGVGSALSPLRVLGAAAGSSQHEGAPGFAHPAPASARSFRGALCFFSKHLGELGPSEMAIAVKEAGFDAVDLTVRPKGHVEPQRVTDDLPRAVAAIRRAGLGVPMITTALTSADDRSARPTLVAAREAGIGYFKPGYYRYALKDIHAEIAGVGQQLVGLAALAQETGVTMGFHNHERNVGAALWDIAPVIDRLDAKWSGYYFDPRHAVVEGGGIAWKVATQLVMPRLKMVAVKDFYWHKGPRGWEIRNCPLGEGMVDWTWFTSALAQATFDGPISFHFEYDIPGATPAERTARTVAAARQDLHFLRGRLAAAYR